MWFHGRPRMNARDDSANAVTEMAKITISGERIRRSSSAVTFNAEKTRAPPSIDRRTARWPAMGEFATYATAAWFGAALHTLGDVGCARRQWSPIFHCSLFMTQPARSASDKLTGEERKTIALQALAGAEPISALAARNGVSRPTVYRQMNRADAALAYMKKQGLSHVFLDALRQRDSASFADQCAWQHHLDGLGMNTPRYRNIATEGALLGSLKRRGVAPDLAIISDDAGQFNVLIHGLCWVHAERLVHKLLPLNDQHREDIARVRHEIWTLYADLKAYKLQPTTTDKHALATRFDAIFTQKTRYATLNRLLSRLHMNN